MADVINVSGREFPLEIGTSAGRGPRIFKLKPGGVADVDDAYAEPRYPAEGRDPIPSVVERISNGCVLPATDPRAKDLYAAHLEKMNGPTPAPEPPAPRQVQKGR